MTDTIDKLSKTLELVEKENKPVAPAKPVAPTSDVDDDYAYSRQIYKELIDIGRDNIAGLSEVCRQTEHPRAYEVLSRSIKDVADTTGKLMDLQKDKKAIKGEKAKAAGVTNVFVGSVTELQKAIKAKQDAIIDVTPEDTKESE
jgi:hypothetical protein